jgi:hypothetical protein
LTLADGFPTLKLPVGQFFIFLGIFPATTSIFFFEVSTCLAFEDNLLGSQIHIPIYSHRSHPIH